MKVSPIRKYLREERLPTIFCPGCGLGIIINATLTAIDQLKINMDKTVMVSGIGCSGRIPGYIKVDSLHTTHGRAIAYATGIKLANPELNVIVFTGDGDTGAIGIGHFVHAARRNIDMKVICINNLNYALTGGQFSPTTPKGAWTYTSPYGNIEGFFDLCELAVVAGASYVARWTVREVYNLINSIKKALKKKGFCFIEVVSPCPTNFGRRNKMETAQKIINFFKEREIKVKDIKGLDREELRGKLIIGEFVDRELPEFTETYKELVLVSQKKFKEPEKPGLAWIELEIRY